MTPDELFEKQNKITELEQDLYESITKSVYNYNQHFYFVCNINKTSVQTDFIFDFFIPDVESSRERKKIRGLEFKTTGYKTPNSTWSDAVQFNNASGEINNVYAFFMMNSKDFKIDKNLLEKPSELKPVYLKKKDTDSVIYEKYEAVSLVEFLKDVHTRIIFPLLKKEAQDWPEILSDHKKILNNIVAYLGTHETNILTLKQTDGLLNLQSHYQRLQFHKELDTALIAKSPKPKMKI